MDARLRRASKKDEPALVTALFSRRLAQPLARLCVRLGIPANAVTVAGGLCWIAALPLAPLAGVFVRAGRPAGPWLWLACAVLWNAGYWLDVVDGSVARMTGTSSRAGFFLDYVFHLLSKPALLFSAAMGAAICAPDPCAQVLLVLAVLSVPANGAADSTAAELALRAEVAAGRLRPGEGAAALWLGADAVVAPAARKRATPLRALATLAREVLSYYLQYTFVSLLVLADLVLSLVLGAPPRGPLGAMPVTGVGLALLCAALALRIPLRERRERRRLAALGSSSALRAFARFRARLRIESLLFAGCGAGAAFFAARISPTLWASVLGVCAAPLGVVACVPAEEGGAAHVLCQTAPRSPAPPSAWEPRWPRGPLVVLLFSFGLLFGMVVLGPISPGVRDSLLVAAFCTATVVAPALSLFFTLLLPFRLARAYQRLHMP